MSNIKSQSRCWKWLPVKRGWRSGIADKTNQITLVIYGLPMLYSAFDFAGPGSNRTGAGLDPTTILAIRWHWHA
eukprot:6203584-Pleurochrysis_carterae.AAC.4